MTSPNRGRDRETNSVTLVVIPHHGASLLQWRLPRYAWGILILAVVSLLGSAAWVVSRHIQYSVELSRLDQQVAANRQIAAELGQSREEMIHVAQMEFQLRDMLHYKSAKALFHSDDIGGPSDEDLKQLAQVLENQPDQAVEQANSDTTSLIASAQAREKNFEDIRQYVDHKRSLLASKPTGQPVHGWISSGFGARVNPFSGEKGFHTGVDIANDTGTPIHATADGHVAYAGWEGGYGKLVVLEHGHGFSTYYGHMSEIKVTVGQEVRRGTVVGLMGQTGDATGPHVHYEVRIGGQPVDPTKYMQ